MDIEPPYAEQNPMARSRQPTHPVAIHKEIGLTKAKTIAVGTIAIALVGAGLWATYATPIVFCAFLQEDIMDRVFCGTLDKLDNYDERPDEAIRWLLADYGEAPSVVAMTTFLDWSFEEQDNFIGLLARIGHENADRLVGRMTLAAQQTGQVDRFVGEFRSRREESERLRLLLERMEEQSR